MLEYSWLVNNLLSYNLQHFISHRFALTSCNRIHQWSTGRFSLASSLTNSLKPTQVWSLWRIPPTAGENEGFPVLFLTLPTNRDASHIPSPTKEKKKFLSSSICHRKNSPLPYWCVSRSAGLCGFQRPRQRHPDGPTRDGAYCGGVSMAPYKWNLRVLLA